MVNQSTDNLLTVLHRWASGQDENFITDAFAHLLRRLLHHEPSVGVKVLDTLTNGKIRVAVADADRTVVSTQVSLVQGRPDVEIRNGKQLTFVESKVESGLGNRQVERYLAELDGKKEFSSKTLVLLSRYPISLPPTVEDRVVKRRWFQVADWLRTHRGAIRDQTSLYLSDQFVDFLKARGMTMEKVGPELVAGVRSLQSLLLMIEEGVAPTKIECTPTRGRDFAGFNLSARRFFFGIYYANPSTVVFETYECPVPKDAVELAGGIGKIVSEAPRPSRHKWVNELVLDDADVSFFELGQEQQTDRISGFLLGSLSSLNKMGISAHTTGGDGLKQPASP